MPLLEEIDDAEDIDNLDMDLAEFDPSLRTPIAPAKPQPSIVRSQDGVPETPLFPPSMMGNNPIMENMFKQFQQQQANDPQGQQQQQALNRQKGLYPGFTDEQIEEIKGMQLIYPCYFDIKRSVKQGRRVNKKYAVENPLLKTILDCCRVLKIAAVFEPEKTHPQDFGNPGRVRIILKDDGKAVYQNYPTKRSLFIVIGKYLQQHKTTWKAVREMPGPQELDAYAGKDIPHVKGFKMNEIVPLHSPMIYQSPTTELIYKKEFMEKPKPVAPITNTAPPKPKAKYMQVRR